MSNEDKKDSLGEGILAEMITERREESSFRLDKLTQAENLGNQVDCNVDYFKILGLTKDSSLGDVTKVRNAHYKLAYKFHPDKNGGTKESNDVMASVNNAVDVVKMLITNKIKACGAKEIRRHDDFLREIDSKYGSFHNYFLSANKEASPSVDSKSTVVEHEYVGDQVNFAIDVAVGQ